MQEFFSFNFPLRELFFCTSPAPPPPLPHKFSNRPSLSSSCLLPFVGWVFFFFFCVKLQEVIARRGRSFIIIDLCWHYLNFDQIVISINWLAVNRKTSACVLLVINMGQRWKYKFSYIRHENVWPILTLCMTHSADNRLRLHS